MRKSCELVKSELLRTIEQQFSHDAQISAAVISAGSREQSSEYAYIQDFYAGRSWREIEPDDLLNRYPSGTSAAVTFLSDAGLRKYVPLFMSCILKDIEGSVELGESILYHFRPEEADTWDACSEGQKGCIAQFLQYLVKCAGTAYSAESHSDSAPAITLARYWHRYL